MKQILILFAHPAYQRSRANKRLVDRVRDLEGVTFHDLYEAYPDFNIDVASEQRQLLDHDLLVFHHPFYWYSCPALLKEWQDLVLEHGFAYGRGGTSLAGKALLSVITTGGSADAYHADGVNRYEITEFLRPFEQTATLCGMDYLPPFVAHGIHKGGDVTVMQRYADAYARIITGLRDETLEFHGQTTLNDTTGGTSNA